MKIHKVIQGSGEWLGLRRGVVTASEFDALITPEWKARTGQGPETYLYKKITEKLIGFVGNGSGGSFAMDQGTIFESEALPYMEFTYDLKIERVGFITSDDGRIGCSPDGLIGEDGGIEVKCPLPETHLRYFMEGVVPKEYLAQVHGSMLVTGRKWWKFLSYSRQFPALVVHVERDEEIQAKLRASLDAFLVKFDEKMAVMNKIRADELEKGRAEYYATDPDYLKWAAAQKGV